jgi:hypothetical protein
MQYEEATPNPEYLIKSIAEQGYSLETALADLIDNSISAYADKIEILVDNSDNKLTLYLSDNGKGMTEKELADNMKFPSQNVDNKRASDDLGRFGLGMKTASFSQTRKFTVLSRKKEDKIFNARTWDVGYLKECHKWRIIKNSDEEIIDLIKKYNHISDNHQAEFEDFTANTIIIWQGLYKFENYLNPDNQYKHFKTQLNEITSEYLGIVFHKFFTKQIKPLQIRINNTRVQPFNPFQSKTGMLPRSLGLKEMRFGDDVLKMDACVLPVSACDNEKEWTTGNKNLMDLEGIYIYRGDRIIFFGGWNGIIKKEARIKLARLRIEVGNINDDKLQLNVSKSKISIPYELNFGVLKYVAELRDEAKKEYSNRGLKNRSDKPDDKSIDLLSRIPTTKGAVYEINTEYPLLKIILESMNSSQKNTLNVFLRAVNKRINKQRHADDSYIEFSKDTKDDKKKFIDLIENLKSLNYSEDEIADLLLKDFSLKISDLSIDK